MKSYPRLVKLIAAYLYKPTKVLSENDRLLAVNKHIAIYKGTHPGSKEFVYLNRWYKGIIAKAFTGRHTG